eukprot:TRINITY_DN6407_c0_g1_i3.p1 TRINITY_DN6407_c0_g1~~TRINITY_DN6407_c0_g1_i3.p1  ORF type:complete len:210 (-),score=34.43 TRINITY_DN6407_c0_g1_i3:203-832(-)
MASRSSSALFICALVLALALGASARALTPPKRFNGDLVKYNLYAGLKAKKNYTTFMRLLKDSDLDRELPDLFNYYETTVFAPTDAAFKALPKDAAALLGDKKRVLREVLRLHFVKGKKVASALIADKEGAQYLTAAQQGRARLFKASSKGDKDLEVNALNGAEVRVGRPDAVVIRVVATHGVDAVILPKELKKVDDETSLKKCFDNAKL